MRAVVQDRYGVVDVLRVADVPRPTAGPGQVLVRVQAASVHPDVWHVLTGRPYVLRLMGAGLRRPRQRVPGTDVAGVVEEVGPGVTRFAVGDDVYGETLTGHQWHNAGAFAEYAVAAEHRLGRRPSRLSPEQAAALPTSGVIAVQAVRDEGGVRTGHQVLVHGAAGGVGHLAVQIAAAYGAHVTASDLPDKLAMALSMGAHEVVDPATDVTRGDRRYDVVVDVPGDRSFRTWRRVLAPDGRYVLVGHDQYGRKGSRVLGGMAPALWLVAQSPFRRQLVGVRAAKDPGDRLAELSRLVEEGAVTPWVDRTYGLDEVADAVRHLAGGAVCGKVVLTL
ncbi:MAG: NAD(P)-dependent alcohol dehydrogenase [Actinomycetes bacterium]